MLDVGYITEKQYKKIAVDNGSVPIPKQKPDDDDTRKYYADWVMNQLTDLIGTPDRDLIVNTTLWPDTQKIAENAVNNVLDSEGRQRRASQAAVVMMDTDGAVRAMVGGRNYNASQFNRATQALRQPGSSFKPFVYLTALENGWTPDDMIEDSPITVGKYHPDNYDNEYFGDVPLHFALAHSLNSAAVRLAQAVGPGKIVALAHNLGIQATLQPNLSLALGSYGAPVIQMVTAYTTIANGGVGVDPYAIASVTDSDGNVIYMHRPKAVPLQVASYRSVQELAGMMRETIDEGTGRRAQIPYLAAGKTGTSQDYRDAWFIGFSGPFATGVWVGNDDNTSMKGVTGGSLPADIWKQVMIEAYAEAGKYDFSTQSRLALPPNPMSDQQDETYAPLPLKNEGPIAGNRDQQFIGTGHEDSVPPPAPKAKTFRDVLRSLF
jgi:penicillin-binding protein 1A